MAAVPIYVWNGTAWQETGPTIPVNPIKYQASAPSSPSTGDIWVDSDGDVTSGSTQLQRFRFVATGGQTTISGADANGAVLAYTSGMEQVVLNGAVLVRGLDYTATNGTTISGLSPALVVDDVLEVFSFMAFNVANTYTQSQVDGLITTGITNAIGTVQAASVYRNSTQSVASSTYVKMQFNTAEFDTDTIFDSTNNRLIPKVAGYYQVNGVVQFASSISGVQCRIYKNGSTYKNGVNMGSGQVATANTIMYLNGTTDYVEFWVAHLQAGSQNVNAGLDANSLNICLIRKA